MSKPLLGMLPKFMLICFNLSEIAWIPQHQNDLFRTGFLRYNLTSMTTSSLAGTVPKANI
jgi:hypothetical protein